MRGKGNFLDTKASLIRDKRNLFNFIDFVRQDGLNDIYDSLFKKFNGDYNLYKVYQIENL